MMKLTQPIIFFDGVCNFCCASVQFVIKRDKKQRYQFCQLQSIEGKAILAQYNEFDTGLSSIILLQNRKIYKKSSAALRVAWHLNAVWPLMTIFFVVPKTIRDMIYDFIGNRRYRWFGRKNLCWVPDENIKQRFISK